MLNLPFCHSSTRCHVVFAKSAYYTDDIKWFQRCGWLFYECGYNRLRCVWFREQISSTSLIFSAQTRMHSITGCLEKDSRRIVWCWTHLSLYHWLQSLAWLLFLVMNSRSFYMSEKNAEVMFFGLNGNKHFIRFFVRHRISSQVNCYRFLSCLS